MADKNAWILAQKGRERPIDRMTREMIVWVHRGAADAASSTGSRSEDQNEEEEISRGLFNKEAAVIGSWIG
jgi:hypothetical protein